MAGLVEGQVLAGRFELLRRIGGGGMGEVWLARDAELGEKVALKILAPALTAEPAAVELLRDECRRARALVHPNILRVHDFHTDGPLAFISMQHLAGGNLTSLRGRSFREILPPLTMICDALEYAHRQGVIHRDLKAANVLLDQRGVACLGDFGIAGMVTGETARAHAGGSMPAMSPQQLDGGAPAVADDVYGLGALLYELIAGRPLFHPDVTAERVREQVPTLPEKDGAGEAVPEPLLRLMEASLAKDPARRPAGVAAVRSVLEELRADYPPDSSPADNDVIRPVARRTSAPGPVPAATIPKPSGAGLSPRWVVGGMALLLALAIGVVFLLPQMVDQRPAAPVRAPEPPSQAAPAAPPSGGSAEQRAAADDALGDLLRLQDELRAVAVERWGGTDWAEAQRFYAAGDDRYRERDYVAAANEYRRATTLLKVLKPRVPEVLNAALDAGDEALLDGDRNRAIEQFDLALAIDPGNERAEAGLKRAGRLDELLAVLGQAMAHEDAGEIEQAVAAYEAALEVDPDWTAAKEGLDRTRTALARNRYETSMANGFAALSAGNFDAARSAFRAALSARPGDPDAQAALRQVDNEARLQQLVRLEREARELEAAEDWTAAADKYRAALRIDPALESSKKGLAQAEARAELAARLEAEVANAETLNDQRNWNRARALADEARAATPKGPVLARQIAALEKALLVASTPVPVHFESDNQTNVVIHKVGRLGTFDDKTVKLRPGRYVAVGSRDGYRDSRRSFLVAADGSTPTIVVRCEEPI